MLRSRSRFLFVLVALLLIPTLGAAQVDVIELPLPPGYEIEFMDFADDLFWVADHDGLTPSNLPKFIHLVDPATGLEITAIPSAVTQQSGARDIAVVGDFVYQAEDGPHLVHKSLKSDGTPLLSSGHAGTFPSGVASDGNSLFVVEQEQFWIQERRLSDLSVVSQFPLSPDFIHSGMTYVAGHLWVTRHSRTIPQVLEVARIDPNSGDVVEVLEPPDGITNALDIAYDGCFFWFLLFRPEQQIVRAPAGWGGPITGDTDCDGVGDDLDVCPDTVIPEALVPSRRLRVNRWALMDGDGAFDTVQPKGNGPARSYSIQDTGGCSCEQIVGALGLGKGHIKFGCSIGAMDRWVALVSP